MNFGKLYVCPSMLTPKGEPVGFDFKIGQEIVTLSQEQAYMLQGYLQDIVLHENIWLAKQP